MQDVHLNPGCYTIPLGSDLLWWLSIYLTEEQHTNPLVILPTQRAVDRLRRMLYKKDSLFLERSKIISYDELTTTAEAKTAAQSLLWTACNDRSLMQSLFGTLTPSFQQQQKWATLFENTLNELYAHSINADSLEKFSENDPSLGPFLSSFRLYQEALRQKHLTHPTGALIERLKLFNAKIPSLDAPVYLVIDGPTPPNLQAIAATLCQNNYVFVCGEIADLPPLLGYHPNSCYTSLNQTLKKQDITPQTLDIYANRKALIKHLQDPIFHALDAPNFFENITLVEASNELLLSQEIITIAQTSFANNIRNLTIVTPNRQLAKIIRMTATATNIAVDDSFGAPLSETLLGYLLLELLKLLQTPTNYKLLLNIITHTSLKAHWDTFPAKLDAFGRLNQVSFHRALQNYMPENGHENELLISLRELITGTIPNDFFERLTYAFACLERWGNDPENQLGFKEIMAIVEEVDNVDMLEFMLQSTPYRVPTPTGQHIRIMGPLEARLMQPELVIIASLNEGEWPSPVASNPWLPPKLRERLGLPPADQIVGVTSKIFLSLLGCKQVYLCRITEENGQPCQPSRWLERLNVLSTLSKKPLLHYKNKGLHYKKPEAHVSPFKIPENLIPRRVSISDIHLFINDPTQFILRRILKLEDLPMWETAADHRDKGIIIHKVLEVGIKENLTLTAMIDLAFQKIKALNLTVHDRMFWEAQVTTYLQNFITLHDATSAKHTWTEAKGEWTVKTCFGPVTIVGQADRIDQLSDGSLHVVDYKTGSLPSKQSVYKGLSPQLPILGLMAMHGAFQLLSITKPFMVSYWDLKEGSTVNFMFDELVHLEQDFITKLETLLNPESVFELK